MQLGVASMGLGGLVAGLVGIGLPEGRRLGALFALIAGAGVGLTSLGFGGIGQGFDGPSPFTFFLASVAGLVTVCVSCAIAWRRAAPGRRIEEPEG